MSIFFTSLKNRVLDEIVRIKSSEDVSFYNNTYKGPFIYVTCISHSDTHEIIGTLDAMKDTISYIMWEDKHGITNFKIRRTG